MEKVSLIWGIKSYATRPSGLHVNQTGYTCFILDRFNVKDCNPVRTPSSGVEVLSCQQANTLLDDGGVKLFYQSIVGSLLYILWSTRWNISYPVLQLARATSKPSTAHLKSEACFADTNEHQELDIIHV